MKWSDQKYFETFFDTCVRRQNRIFPTDDTKQTPEKWNSVDRDKPIKLEKQKESNKIELNWIWSYFSETVVEWMRSFSPIIFAVANSSRQPASNSNEKKQLCVIFVSTNVVQRWKFDEFHRTRFLADGLCKIIFQDSYSPSTHLFVKLRFKVLAYNLALMCYKPCMPSISGKSNAAGLISSERVEYIFRYFYHSPKDLICKCNGNWDSGGYS